MKIVLSPAGDCDPEAMLEKHLSTAGAAQDHWLAVPWRLPRYWRRSADTLPGTALYRVQGGRAVAMALLEGACPSTEQLRSLLRGAAPPPVFPLDAPLHLAPVEIPKPWGGEWWYTGIEQRGQAGVVEEHSGAKQSLPWLLEAAPRRLTAQRSRQLVLLKILRPFADPLFGDLYFECHEQKREVYVVTGVDRKAWPDGRGAIRFGFDSRLRRRYADDESFRKAFIRVVEEYEQIRRRLDTALDKLQEGNAQRVDDKDLEQRRRMLQSLPRDWLREEQRRRRRMMAFTALRPLAPGDVLQVPLLTPHALQHGVRVVEFQTPVYERRILFFTQKVRTQKHWDTRSGARLMSLDAPPAAPLALLHQEDGVRVERIAAHGDFEARRVRLAAGARYHLAAGKEAGVIIGVAGLAHLQDAVVEPEQALLLPTSWRGGPLHNRSAQEAVLLLAWGRGDT